LSRKTPHFSILYLALEGIAFYGFAMHASLTDPDVVAFDKLLEEALKLKPGERALLGQVLLDSIALANPMDDDHRFMEIVCLAQRGMGAGPQGFPGQVTRKGRGLRFDLDEARRAEGLHYEEEDLG
jgi:hypothetical protein